MTSVANWAWTARAVAGSARLRTMGRSRAGSMTGGWYPQPDAFHAPGGWVSRRPVAGRDGGVRGRLASGPTEKQNAFLPAKPRMKACGIHMSGTQTGAPAGLILRFDGEAEAGARPTGRIRLPDEHCRRDVRTPGLNLVPAFPVFRPVAVLTDQGICNPLPWRNRPRFSRGSRTSDSV